MASSEPSKSPFLDAVNEWVDLRVAFRNGPPTLDKAVAIGTRMNELLAFIMEYRENKDLTKEPDAATNAKFMEWVLDPE